MGAEGRGWQAKQVGLERSAGWRQAVCGAVDVAHCCCCCAFSDAHAALVVGVLSGGDLAGGRRWCSLFLVFNFEFEICGLLH